MKSFKLPAFRFIHIIYLMVFNIVKAILVNASICVSMTFLMHLNLHSQNKTATIGYEVRALNHAWCGAMNLYSIKLKKYSVKLAVHLILINIKIIDTDARMWMLNKRLCTLPYTVCFQNFSSGIYRNLKMKILLQKRKVEEFLTEKDLNQINDFKTKWANYSAYFIKTSY